MVNVIPSYASIDDMGLHVALEAERDFNSMMQTLGIAELRSLEENAVVLESKESNKGIITRFKEWLNKIWGFIKGIFDKVLEFVKKQIEKVNNFLAKIAAKSKQKLKERADKLKDKTKDGKEKTFGTAHSWDGFDDVLNGRGVVWNAINVYDSFEAKLPGYVDKNEKEHASGGAYHNMSDKEKSKFNQEVESLDKKVKGILGVASLTSENIQKKVKSIIAGKEIKANKEYIVKNWDDIFDYGTDFGKTTSGVKKSLNEIKKRFDRSLKELDSFNKNLGDANISYVVSFMKKSKITLTAISNATVANVKARCSEATMFVLRVATAGKAKEEKVEESAVVPASFQTELASLFDF